MSSLSKTKSVIELRKAVQWAYLNMRRKPKDIDRWLDETLDRQADITLSLHPPKDLSIKEEAIKYLKPRLVHWIRRGAQEPDVDDPLAS